MSELLPCPFCGSGWLYETRRNGYCDETPTMFCNSCKAVVTWEQVEEEGVNDKTKAFVREHWNSRAERTCQNADDHKTVWFICSVCGYLQKPSHTRSHCTNCGGAGGEIMKRYLYQKDYHTPPWAMEYEVETAIENRTMVCVTMFSEELDNTRNAITFTVSSKTPFGLTMEIRDHCVDRGITFTEYDFNQVEWEMSRYF